MAPVSTLRYYPLKRDKFAGAHELFRPEQVAGPPRNQISGRVRVCSLQLAPQARQSLGLRMLTEGNC